MARVRVVGKDRGTPGVKLLRLAAWCTMAGVVSSGQSGVAVLVVVPVREYAAPLPFTRVRTPFHWLLWGMGL